VKANQAIYGVATMCRVLEVSASGYYAWQQRPPSARSRADAELSSRITAIHHYSRATYGAPRIHEELLAAGIHVGRKRVVRLMKATGLSGVSQRRWVTTTVRDTNAPRRRIWSSVTSARQDRIVWGWPTSATSRPGPAFSISP
jgi:putative transposase